MSALQGKTNKSHFTRDIACKVKQRILALIKDGGVNALRTAQSARDAEHSPAAADVSDLDDMDLMFNSALDAAKLDEDDDKKSKYSNSPITATKAQRLTMERSLTPTKMLHQLRNDVRLTDDIFNISVRPSKPPTT
ncbi:hypothetical protein ACHAP7_011828 [Fusarium lateritium]